MKTMSVGLIGTPEQAEEIIASGKADFVVIGRTALYDPSWAWHAAEALGVETDYAPKYRMARSEEHTSELQSLMRISYAVFCLKKTTQHTNNKTTRIIRPHKYR